MRSFSVRSSRPWLLTLVTILGFAGTSWAADPGKLTVKVDQPGVKISPMLYGLMTEEINHAYDGGLYAELIQNRAFKDDARAPAHWNLVKGNASQAKMSLVTTGGVSAALGTSLRVDVDGAVALENDGYWGVPVKPDTTYTVSFYAKAADGFSGPVNLAIRPKVAGAGPASFASGTVNGLTADWKKYTVKIKTGADVKATTDGVFSMKMEGKGSVWFSLVSVMPPTFNDRPNGMRPDLMQLMGDMKPAFLRLPGGNYLEGNTIAERFNWKETIGGLENRPGHPCPWGYRSSDGMGLLEFLEWCEDLKMEPVLGVFAGYALGGQYVRGDALKPHIQDALDEIEYITGGPDTKWGAQRVKDGHAAPFKLTYVEVGNEDFFDKSGSYDERYAAFHTAIKAKYPQLQIIATTPVKGIKPDLIDDHYYRSAAAMENDVHHYDKIDRNGPKIFVGEWATTEGSPTPTMNAALGDAAWMIGMERNSDLIVMSCYAPLLVNVNNGARQWGTNLIGYDALKSYASPSYYVQKMFNHNRGDVVLPVDLVPQVVQKLADVPPPHGGVGAATWSTNAEYKDLKVTKPDGTVLFSSDFSKDTAGFKFFGGAWKADEGTLHQTSNENECRAITGDKTWGDVNYTLKARKISGNEGFMPMFNIQDENNYMWFNVGGWNNTQSAIELAEGGARRTIGNTSQFKVETNRWYDVRVEVRGKDVKCLIDGQQICAATFTPTPQPDPMYATASRDNASGDVIVKVVNVSANPQQMGVALQGLPSIINGTVEVIAGDPGTVNTIAEPEKVAPKRGEIKSTATTFVQEFPAHSVSILRFKTK